MEEQIGAKQRQQKEHGYILNAFYNETFGSQLQEKIVLDKLRPPIFEEISKEIHNDTETQCGDVDYSDEICSGGVCFDEIRSDEICFDEIYSDLVSELVLFKSLTKNLN
ncbi:32397_t:CDS:2 [Gigaspora margarita]|uniref:32397_t:CDS:1 n=1 Tax=Gigaspora margarita TaxID=4874 RepID=A0ABN7UNR9_GIGMA|nr:32397_t:CDS:2 [Gigaspora margarita]